MVVGSRGGVGLGNFVSGALSSIYGVCGVEGAFEEAVLFGLGYLIESGLVGREQVFRFFRARSER